MNRNRLTRRRFAQSGMAAAALAATRSALAAPSGPIEKPRLTVGIALDAASFSRSMWQRRAPGSRRASMSS